MLALFSAHLEDVREVRAEFETEAHFDGRQREVADPQRHVQPVLPQELSAIDVQRAAMQEYLALGADVRIREVHCE